ncbi:DUS4L [Cordylochernes scorpioides]|uniref:tRNA-dihydrouridine synthase n=1 Tax=Cordylochernes scorpioides TaxID=51811 RepID=A0ABY6LTY5_9ARAC|nr:DUS4L [Cordylochernes scorpioides]
MSGRVPVERLGFRRLVRKYDCDLCFTPMIVSSSFINSVKARDSDFTTNAEDRPLIVQFAASNGTDLADAAEIIYKFADGVDLNCGCPQRWAMSEGYGAHLIHHPQLLKDMVLQTRNRLPGDKFTLSCSHDNHVHVVQVMIIMVGRGRGLLLLLDMASMWSRETVSLCQQLEKAGLSWLTVHARTPTQRHEPINSEALRTIRDSVSLPLVGNGDIFNLEQAEDFQRETGVNGETDSYNLGNSNYILVFRSQRIERNDCCAGVMSARGLLANPALYAGYSNTPTSCVEDWVEIALGELGVPFTPFHHHLSFMLEHCLPRGERKLFNLLSSPTAVLDFLYSANLLTPPS